MFENPPPPCGEVEPRKRLGWGDGEAEMTLSDFEIQTVPEYPHPERFALRPPRKGEAEILLETAF